MSEPLVGRYQLVREIGRGGFGLVEEYRDLIHGTEVAIKTIAPHFIKQETKRLIREVDIMAFLYSAHPHVIDFSSMFVTRCRGGVDSKVSLPAPVSHRLNVMGSDYQGLSIQEKCALHHRYLAELVDSVRKEEAFTLHIVMPLMKGDLTSFIKLCCTESEQRRLNMSPQYLRTTAAIFAFQLFFGLDYLHKCGIIHRDLKPENILVRLDESIAFRSSVCIADLGLAREMQDSETFYVCTRYYRAPEVVMTAIKGHSGLDIWSMGCILYEMCTNRTLFTVPSALDDNGAWEGVRASSQLEVILNIVGTPNANDVLKFMPNGNASSYLQRSAKRPSRLLELLRKNWVLDCDEAEKTLWYDLIMRCLAFFPQQRPTAEEASKHPLFQRYDIRAGVNIFQSEERDYMPTFTDRDTSHALTEDNKARILQLVRTIMVNTAPTMDDTEDDGEEEEGGVGDDDDKENEDDEVEIDYNIDDAGDMADYMLDGDVIDSDEEADEEEADDNANKEEEEDDGGGFYRNSNSMSRIRTGGATRPAASRSNRPNNAVGSGPTTKPGQTQQGNNNNNNEEDEDDLAISAARYASAMNIASMAAHNEDEEEGGTTSGNNNGSSSNNNNNNSNNNDSMNAAESTLRAGRVQARPLGRRQSRGSFSQLMSSIRNPHSQPSAKSEAADGSADPSAPTAPRQAGSFYGTAQAPQQSQAAKGAAPAEADLEEAGFTMNGTNAGWYSASFFLASSVSNANANAAQSAERPRPNSSSAAVMSAAPATAAAAGTQLGASGVDLGRHTSLSADALQMLGFSGRNQIAQPRVSRSGIAPSSMLLASSGRSRAGMSANHVMTAQQQQQHFQAGSAAAPASGSTAHGPSATASNKAPHSFTDFTTRPDSGSGNDITGLEDYGYMMEGDLALTLGPSTRAASAGKAGQKDVAPSPPTGVHQLVQDTGNVVVVSSSVRHPGTEEYAYSNIRGIGGGGTNVGAQSNAPAANFSDGGYDINFGSSVAAQHLNTTVTTTVSGANRDKAKADNKASGLPAATSNAGPAAPTTQQQGRQEPARRVQPLEPMKNNFFSAINIGSLRLGQQAANPALGDIGADSTTYYSGGFSNSGTSLRSSGQGGAAVELPEADDSGLGSDLANRFTSTAVYNLDLGPEGLHNNRGSKVQRVPEAKPEAVPNALEEDDDDDDGWAMPVLSPPDRSATLGIGGSSAASGNRNEPGSKWSASAPESGLKEQRRAAETSSPDSIMNIMDQVTMGLGADVDMLYSAVKPLHNSTNTRNGKNAGMGPVNGFGALPPKRVGNVADDPDFPAISDTGLRLRYKTVESTDQGAQEAITSILEELGTSTHDAARSEQLRSLLSYFTSLQYSLRSVD